MPEERFKNAQYVETITWRENLKTLVWWKYKRIIALHKCAKPSCKEERNQFLHLLRMNIICNDRDSSQIQKKIISRHYQRSAGMNQLVKSWAFKKSLQNHLPRVMEVELIIFLWSSPQPYFLWGLCWSSSFTALSFFRGQCWFQGLAITGKSWKPAKGNPALINFYYRQASVSPNISLWLLLKHLQLQNTNNNFIIIKFCECWWHLCGSRDVKVGTELWDVYN